MVRTWSAISVTSGGTGTASDVLDGGEGDDLFVLSSTSTHSNLWAFNITSQIQFGTGEVINISGMVQYSVVIDGGDGNDRVNLSNGNDAFFLHDSFSGFHDDLELVMDQFGNYSTARINGIEKILAGAGDDLIDMVSSDFSLADQDMVLDGGTGNDTIWGSDANDSIIGGDGDDVLFGGSGQNYLVGGSGADTFQFRQSSTNTVVSDFDPLEGDTISIYTNDEFQLNYWELSQDTLTFYFDGAIIEVELDGNTVDETTLSEVLEIL